MRRLIPVPITPGMVYARTSYPDFAGTFASTGCAVEDLGLDAGGTMIRALTLGDLSTQPVIMLTGHHGNEWIAAHAVLEFMRLLRNGPWLDREVAASLRRFAFYAVPTINPHGHTNLTRRNANGVDLNRNYDHRWAEATGDHENPSSGVYKGPSVASEPETQLLSAKVLELKPAALIDVHTAFGNNYGMSVDAGAWRWREYMRDAMRGFRLNILRRRAGITGLHEWNMDSLPACYAWASRQDSKHGHKVIACLLEAYDDDWAGDPNGHERMMDYHINAMYALCLQVAHYQRKRTHILEGS